MMKLTIQHHAGNPNMCRIPELAIRQVPECEGGGWWLPLGQAEDLLSLSKTGTVLTEKMVDVGFAAIAEYEVWKSERRFPRPNLIAHIWNRLIEVDEAGVGAEVDDGWLPAETAPKDGSEFIACNRGFHPFSCQFWQGQFVHFEPNDGPIYYSFDVWKSFPEPA